jgi:hypothetical protein
MLPQAVVRFLEKNEDYGSGSDEFGPKAQIMDISRKYKKLKAAIWDGEVMIGEPIEEVIDDMIGHLLLLRESWDHDPGGTPSGLPGFDYTDWAMEYSKAMESMMEQAVADQHG